MMAQLQCLCTLLKVWFDKVWCLFVTWLSIRMALCLVQLENLFSCRMTGSVSLTVKCVFMFTGYLIVLLLMPCSIFTCIDWLTSWYWALASCGDCGVCERRRKWMLKHAAIQSGLVMKSSSSPDSLSQAQAHLLRGSLSLIQYTSIYPSISYFPSFSTPMPTFRQPALLLLHLIVLGVFNLSLLSACLVQYLSPLSPASFCPVLLSFIALFHSG